MLTVDEKVFDCVPFIGKCKIEKVWKTFEGMGKDWGARAGVGGPGKGDQLRVVSLPCAIGNWWA